MPSKGTSRRDYIMLLAVEPKDGTTTCEVQISFNRMQTVGRRSLGHAKECGLILPMILQKPTAIFEGLRRDEDEDRWGFGWRCYCGVPDQSYRSDGTSVPPYHGQVYLVFVNDERRRNGDASSFPARRNARRNGDASSFPEFAEVVSPVCSTWGAGLPVERCAPSPTRGPAGRPIGHRHKAVLSGGSRACDRVPSRSVGR